jgi:hypothetical protein
MVNGLPVLIVEGTPLIGTINEVYQVKGVQLTTGLPQADE